MTFLKALPKLNPVLVIDSHRRQALLFPMQMFIMQRPVLCQSKHVVLSYHQIDYFYVLLNYLWLKSMLLIFCLSFLI